MRRYEWLHINEVWYWDSIVGSNLKTDNGRKRKVFIFALIDDTSRFIVGIDVFFDVFFNDNFVNPMSVIKSAVVKLGPASALSFIITSSLLLFRKRKWSGYLEPQKINGWLGLVSGISTSLKKPGGNLMSYVQRNGQSLLSALKRKSTQDRFFSKQKNSLHFQGCNRKRLPSRNWKSCLLRQCHRKQLCRMRDWLPPCQAMNPPALFFRHKENLYPGGG